uniref:Uncharacterized protein n=1 Tax=Rhizochromulina marina TaxID=1034831 RepID=A0A7S2WU87_9STRA|mmetsp:Transcript_3681/g.10750  ORF Transcript_3681/g.10750 Transcript_3681/m.10750 type:complete len:122 (+) Transcript_3681:44-409(+)
MKWRELAWHVRRAMLSVLCLLLVLEEVSAKKRQRKRKGRGKSRYAQFYYLMAAFVLIIVGPAVYTFCVSLWKDPAVPRLLRAAVQSVRGAVLANMGKTVGSTKGAPTRGPSPPYRPPSKLS